MLELQENAATGEMRTREPLPPVSDYAYHERQWSIRLKEDLQRHPRWWTLVFLVSSGVLIISVIFGRGFHW